MGRLQHHLLGVLQGTPSASNVGTYSNVLISASDAAGSASLPAFSITVTTAGTTSAAAGAAIRPASNTGNGFFVVNGQLYDRAGEPFRIRGVNRLHWDSDSAAGIQKSGANAVRWDIDFTRAATDNVGSPFRRSPIQDGEAPIVDGLRLNEIHVVGCRTGRCPSVPRWHRSFECRPPSLNPNASG